MAVVSELEGRADVQTKNKVFDLEFAMNILACSLPFSVLIILIIYSSGTFFTDATYNFMSAGIAMSLAVIPVFAKTRFIKTYKTKFREVLRSI